METGLNAFKEALHLKHVEAGGSIPAGAGVYRRCGL